MEKYTERILEINEGVKELIGLVGLCRSSVEAVGDRQLGQKNMLENLAYIMDEIKDKMSSSELPKGGYVSENTLVKIIETVRK